QWMASQQKCFEQWLMCITASCGFPLTWLTNSEVLLFMQEFVHVATIVPTHYTLTRRIFPQTLADLRAERDRAIAGLNHQNDTLQFDSWTAVNQHHYDAFMLSLASQVYSVKVYDVSADRKSGDRLFQLVEKVLYIVETYWKVEVVGACSDAGPDGAKAWCKLLRACKDIIFLDCYSHQ
ncbi:uncharacterized protein PHACADRAFT_48162, partial [Phanerochaete carnosa HHB-10118-sp]